MKDQWEDDESAPLESPRVDELEAFDDDELDNSYADSERYELEDERATLRGTSQCDGTCRPQCSWCLAAHSCPEDCAGGHCPYESPGPSLAKERAFELGKLDAQDKTKRKRLIAFVDRRSYFQGYESWIRRNDRRRRPNRAQAMMVCAAFDIGF